MWSREVTRWSVDLGLVFDAIDMRFSELLWREIVEVEGPEDEKQSEPDFKDWNHGSERQKNSVSKQPDDQVEHHTSEPLGLRCILPENERIVVQSITRHTLQKICTAKIFKVHFVSFFIVTVMIIILVLNNRVNTVIVVNLWYYYQTCTAISHDMWFLYFHGNNCKKLK